MSSDSSLSAALVTGASTELGYALSLRLGKKFELSINDLPEASKRLEELKVQIENEGRKCNITVGNPRRQMSTFIDEHCSDHKVLTEPVARIQSIDNKVAELLYKRAPGAKINGILCKIGNGVQYTYTLVIADDKRAGGSVPGVTSPLKSAIRGLTEAGGM
ncbi:hypothetical protein C0992_012455 [Termitomyces sp. T32_za158]|nr:hypothetical protein C0992_012455 [Termitomyces sp. T32_za158]